MLDPCVAQMQGAPNLTFRSANMAACRKSQQIHEPACMSKHYMLRLRVSHTEAPHNRRASLASYLQQLALAVSLSLQALLCRRPLPLIPLPLSLLRCLQRPQPLCSALQVLGDLLKLALRCGGLQLYSAAGGAGGLHLRLQAVALASQLADLRLQGRKCRSGA